MGWNSKNKFTGKGWYVTTMKLPKWRTERKKTQEWNLGTVMIVILEHWMRGIEWFMGYRMINSIYIREEYNIQAAIKVNEQDPPTEQVQTSKKFVFLFTDAPMEVDGRARRMHGEVRDRLAHYQRGITDPREASSFWRFGRLERPGIWDLPGSGPQWGWGKAFRSWPEATFRFPWERWRSSRRPSRSLMAKSRQGLPAKSERCVGHYSHNNANSIIKQKLSDYLARLLNISWPCVSFLPRKHLHVISPFLVIVKQSQYVFERRNLFAFEKKEWANIQAITGDRENCWKKT